MSFDVSNPLLWNIENGKYTAKGSEDTFAWSENIVEGDVKIQIDIESNYKDGEGVIILYGDGTTWSQGCLIFNITPNSQSIRAHSVYGDAKFIRETKIPMDFVNQIFRVVIEIRGDKATMYVDGNKILSTFLSKDIARKGRVGLHKHWQRPNVTFSNIRIEKNRT